MVSYAGHIVERGPAEQLLSDPRYPYTQLLLQAAPEPRAPLKLAGGTDAGEPPKVVGQIGHTAGVEMSAR
ncbi:MAG TPA: hypothetical protein VN786_09515 [Acidimicrobiales bacterium]|nr:hypothetical protein [Acidimicrobiales bacterium]